MKFLIAVPKYNLSIEEDYTYNFPLGLAYISSILKENNYDVDCLNMNHYKGTVETLLKKALDSKKYDFVCIGGNALAYSVLKKMIDSIKIHETSPKIILGGPIITSEPKIMFELLNPDIAVVGEGELTIIELLKFIENNKNLKDVKGLVYKEGDKTILTSKRDPIKNIESVPFPDLEGLEFEKYLSHSHCNDSWTNQVFDYPRPYPLLGSRGCPFNCSFCWHPEKYRARSIKDIIKEINLMVERYKINVITIYDDCFSANKERLYEFCREIKKISEKNKVNIKWSCQLMVNTADDEMLRVMGDAGCESISYGFESFSPIVLKSMRKPITPEKIDKALKSTLKANIGIQGNFIFGDISETKETARETLKYWKSCTEAHQISLGFVQPYPGSDLYNYCFEKKIIKEKMDYIKNQMGPDTRLNMTEKMSDEEINELNKYTLNIFRKYFKFVTPSSLKKMGENIYEFDFKCPFCKKTIHYKNCLIENRFSYGFHLICRNCHMRSVLVGPVKKIAYKFYPQTRKIRNLYIKMKKVLRRKRI